MQPHHTSPIAGRQQPIAGRSPLRDISGGMAVRPSTSTETSFTVSSTSCLHRAPKAWRRTASWPTIGGPIGPMRITSSVIRESATEASFKRTASRRQIATAKMSLVSSCSTRPPCSIGGPARPLDRWRQLRSTGVRPLRTSACLSERRLEDSRRAEPDDPCSLYTHSKAFHQLSHS
jgi:hypothetical protein